MKKGLYSGLTGYLIVLLIFAVNVSYSQQFTISQINTSQFPLVSTNLMAKDITGNSYKDLVVSDFSVFDGGLVNIANMFLDCRDTVIDPAVNIVLVLDQSGSMEDPDSATNTRRWDWVKEGVQSFLNALNFQNGTKVGMVTFAKLSRIICDFTENKKRLMDSLNKVIVNGGTDYNPPFLDPTSGAVNFLVNYDPLFERRRIIVFLTDGQPNANTPVLTDSIIKYCNTNGVQVYGIDRKSVV